MMKTGSRKPTCWKTKNRGKLNLGTAEKLLAQRQNPYFYFYRDKDQKEIDLLIEQDNTLYPIEIKKSAAPSLNAANNFDLLTKLRQPIGRGAVLCLRQKNIPLSPELDAIPIGYL